MKPLRNVLTPLGSVMAKDSYGVLSLLVTPGKTAELDFTGFRFDPKVKCVSLEQAG